MRSYNKLMSKLTNETTHSARRLVGLQVWFFRCQWGGVTCCSFKFVVSWLYLTRKNEIPSSKKTCCVRFLHRRLRELFLAFREKQLARKTTCKTEWRKARGLYRSGTSSTLMIYAVAVQFNSKKLDWGFSQWSTNNHP